MSKQGFCQRKKILQKLTPSPDGDCCTSASFPRRPAKSGQVSVNPALLSAIPGSFTRRAFICQRKQVQSCRTWAEHLTLVVIPAYGRFILVSGSTSSTPPQLNFLFPRLFPRKQSLDGAFWVGFSRNPGDEYQNE